MAALSVLILVFGLVLLVLRWLRGRWLATLSARVAVAVMFVFTGIGHFVAPEPLIEMVPPFLARADRWVALTGVLEILGGVGLLLPRTRRLAAWCLAVYLVAVFSANLHATRHQVGPGGHPQGMAFLWFRAPLQLLFLVWVLVSGLRPSGWR
jgi:uncharacterized membrane protein